MVNKEDICTTKIVDDYSTTTLTELGCLLYYQAKITHNTMLLDVRTVEYNGYIITFQYIKRHPGTAPDTYSVEITPVGKTKHTESLSVSELAPREQELEPEEERLEWEGAKWVVAVLLSYIIFTFIYIYLTQNG